MCSSSGLAAAIETALLPVDPKAAGLARAGGGDPLELALHGGEDYQLLLAVAPDEVNELRELARVFGSEVSVIGTFVEGDPAVTLHDAAGERPLVPRGHDHFRALGS
jgi:thiamine-monophosphate kinase